MAINQQDYFEFGIEIINDEQLKQLFGELKTSLQRKIILDAYKNAAKPIISQARLNLLSNSKGKSSDNFKTMSKGFRIEALKSRVGVKFGIKYYKARWIEWGTDDRSYVKGVKRASLRTQKKENRVLGKEHKTGKIEGIHYFFNAVKAKKDEALKSVSKAILTEINKTVDKYSKGKGKL